jgi:hypothetical protein
MRVPVTVITPSSPGSVAGAAVGSCVADSSTGAVCASAAFGIAQAKTASADPENRVSLSDLETSNATPF